MSVQPFPQLLSLHTHTHMHTPTHLSFLSLLYVHRLNGVIQESEVLALLRLTLSVLGCTLSYMDNCGKRQKLGFLYAGSFVEVI